RRAPAKSCKQTVTRLWVLPLPAPAISARFRSSDNEIALVSSIARLVEAALRNPANRPIRAVGTIQQPYPKSALSKLMQTAVDGVRQILLPHPFQARAFPRVGREQLVHALARVGGEQRGKKDRRAVLERQPCAVHPLAPYRARCE